MADVETDNRLETLVAKCQQGDLAAFAALFTRFQNRVYDLAYAILRDDAGAEDAVQEAFLRVFKRIRDYRGDASFETWLVAIAVNYCRDKLRRRAVRRTLSLESLAPGWLARALGLDQDPEKVLEWREQQTSLWAMVDQLEDRLRLPLILRYHYGLRCDQVARALGLTTGTVYGQLSEGRGRLREMLQDEQSAVSRQPSAVGQ